MAVVAAVGLSTMDCARRHFFPLDSGHHGASPVQVRGKTEPSHRPLSFPPNFKTSRALNHRQSDLQEALVCQPCPPAMEVSCEIILVVPPLLIFRNKNEELLEIDSFFASLYLFRELANNKFWEKILETLGDALN